MMNVYFTPRTEAVSKKTGLCPIAIRVSFENTVVRIMVPTVRVKKTEWNKKDYTVLPSKKNEPYNNHKEFNILLSDIKYRLNELHRKSILGNSKISKEDIINAVYNNEAKKTSNEEASFLDIFQEFIDHSKSFKAERTITGYTTTKNTLKTFFDSRKLQPTLDSLDLKFFDDFRNYCFNEKEFKDNYFAKLIAHIKTFMKWSFDREYHSNVNFMKFKAPEHDIEVIFLTHQELSTLFYHEFKSDKLARVRDLFCFSCFTGLRYSDLANLKNSSIINNNELKINVKKTRQKDLIIPLNDYATEILEKYKGTIYEPLPVISSQKLNNYIKDACKEVRIDTPTRITRYSGGKVIDEVIPKYQLITIHTGRKTFVSNSLMLNIPTAVIKEVTGHRTDRAFQKYVKVTDEFKRDKFKAWNSALNDN